MSMPFTAPRTGDKPRNPPPEHVDEIRTVETPPPASATVLPASAAAAPAPLATPARPSPLPPPAIQPPAVNYRDMPRAEYSAKVMIEAARVSLACRYFRNLYGRWPTGIREIASRTEGIDYDIFMGKAMLVARPDDTLEITVFDGTSFRHIVTTATVIEIPEEQRSASRSDDFKIRFDPEK